MSESVRIIREKNETIKRIINGFNMTPEEKEETLAATHFAICKYVKDDTVIQNIDGWLYYVARNEANRIIKDNLKERNLFCDVPDEEIENIAEKVFFDYDVSGESDHGFKDTSVVELVKELKEPACEILLLHYGDGYKLHEIGERLNINVNTVKTIKQRALRELRKRIIAKGNNHNGYKD